MGDGKLGRKSGGFWKKINSVVFQGLNGSINIELIKIPDEASGISVY
jgi:hypothetical protein